MGGHYGAPLNFFVSSSIMIKFGVLIEVLQITKNLKNDVTAEL